MLDDEDGRGEQSPLPASFQKRRKPFASPEMVRHAIRSAMARRLPELVECEAHKHTMSIVCRGPSLIDTYKDITGYVATVNAAHNWLIEHGRRVHACGLVDPAPWLAEQITPRKDVRYFVGSQCHSLVFDKLKDHQVVVWHANQSEKYHIEDLLTPDSILVPGGTSMALRWLDLGYVLGFRAFEYHGFDCCWRGDRHHIDDHNPGARPEDVELMGFRTHPGWTAQINDLFLRTESMKKFYEPITIKIHGDGLARHLWEQR